MNVTYVHHAGDDRAVVNAARVSFKKKVETFTALDSRLIKYLAAHGHKSPFNHTWVTLHVEAPIFVARQLVKHKFMPWNEVSRRYVDEPPTYWKPTQWRERAPNKKQGSLDTPVSAHEIAESYYDDAIVEADHSYHKMLEFGVCPEQARMVLPQSTYTEWYWSGTLGAWADMYNLRVDPHAQLETREVAVMCGDIIKGLFPISWDALTARETSIAN